MTMEKEKISQVNFKMPENDKKEVTAYINIMVWT